MGTGGPVLGGTRCRGAHRRPGDPGCGRLPLQPPRFAAVTVPTLLLTGSQTDADFAASTTLLAEALPGARVVILAGQGHVAMLTAPELLAAELLGFLQDR